MEKFNISYRVSFSDNDSGDGVNVSVGDFVTGPDGMSEGSLGAAIALQYFIVSGAFQEWMLKDNEGLNQYIQEVLEKAMIREKEMNEATTKS